MNISELKCVAVFACFVCCIGFTGASESTMCPGHEALVESKNVLDLCDVNIPESLGACKKLIDELSSLDFPTTQQRYDLARATYELSELSSDPSEMLELIDQANDLYRLIHEEHPNDISILFELSLHADENESLEMKRRILESASDCSEIRESLLFDLGFHPGYILDSRLSDERRSEIDQHLGNGYDLAEARVWKIRFGKLMFSSLLIAGQVDRAQRLRELIFNELGVVKLRYDDALRTENLFAICDHAAFGLGFARYCLDAIERSLDHDIRFGHRLGDDVLMAIKSMGVTLTLRGYSNAFDEYNHPVNVKQFDVDDILFHSHESVQYAIRLNEIVRSIPVEFQTLELYRNIYVFGKNNKLQLLSNLLDKDPDNAEILGRMSEVRSM